MNALDLDSHIISKLDIQDSDGKNRVQNAALELANNLGIKINIHTPIGASWSDGEESMFIHSFKVEPQTLTGAGDSWDSANIVAYILGLKEEDRLTFSNAYAALYVANPSSEPATMSKTIEFIEGNCF